MYDPFFCSFPSHNRLERYLTDGSLQILAGCSGVRGEGLEDEKSDNFLFFLWAMSTAAAETQQLEDRGIVQDTKKRFVKDKFQHCIRSYPDYLIN